MAGSAVVGILKALLTCDSSEFTAAMSGASKEVVDLGKKLQSDLEPRQRAVNNLVKEFLGGGEIRKAQEYAQAVADIGGADKLVEQDQLRVNKAVADALTHYKALGQEAPKNLLDLELATRRLPEPLDQTNASMDKIWSGLKSAAGLIGVTFTAGAVINFATKVFDAASAVHDNAVALGFSAEAYQRNKFAAEQSGGSVEAFTRAANKLNDSLGEGSKSTVASLKAAGLSFDAIRAMKPEDAWTAVSDAVGKIEDPMERARVAQDLFGKGALELLPGMIEGYKKLGEAATVMSNETVARLEAAQDAWGRFWDKITIVTGSAIGKILELNDASAANQKLMFKADDAYRAVFASTQDATKAAAAYQAVLDSTIGKAKMISPAMAEMNTVIRKGGDISDEAAKQFNEYNKKLQAGADTLTGKALALKVKELADEVRLAGGASHVTAYEAERLGKQLLELEKQGAKIPPVLEEFARKQAVVNSTLAIAHALMGPGQLQAALGGFKTKLEGVPPVMDKIIGAGNDVSGMLTRLGIATVELSGPPPEPWSEWRLAAMDAGLRIEDSIGAGFARLVGHASHFKSEMKNIWEDIKNSVIGYFADIANTFIHDLLDGMLGAIMGRKGAFNAAFSNLIPSGLFGGGGAAGGAAGAAAGAGSAAGGAGAAGGGGAAGAIGAAAGWIAAVLAPLIIGQILNPELGEDPRIAEARQIREDAAYMGMTLQEYLDYTGKQIPEGFAGGGYIPATPGGRRVTVAEGGQGEWLIPDSKMAGMGALGSHTVINNTNDIRIQAWDGVDVDRVVRGPKFKRAFHQATTDDRQFASRVGTSLRVGR